MPSRQSVVTTVTLLILSIVSSHAVHLRGCKGSSCPPTVQIGSVPARTMPILPGLQQAASTFRANQALAAMGRHVALQKRIFVRVQGTIVNLPKILLKNIAQKYCSFCVPRCHNWISRMTLFMLRCSSFLFYFVACTPQLNMQNLNHKMASLARKNDQLQRIRADEQLNHLTDQPPEIDQVYKRRQFLCCRLHAHKHTFFHIPPFNNRKNIVSERLLLLSGSSLLLLSTFWILRCRTETPFCHLAFPIWPIFWTSLAPSILYGYPTTHTALPTCLSGLHLCTK